LLPQVLGEAAGLGQNVGVDAEGHPRLELILVSQSLDHRTIPRVGPSADQGALLDQ
jgi:hypothetical protein